MLKQRLNDIRQRRAEGDAGFTLIELLLVILIIGILAAVVIFSVGGVRDSAESNACKSTVDTVNTASVAHYADTQTYAASLEALDPTYLDLDGVNFTGNVITVAPGETVSYVPADGSVTNTCTA